MPFVTYLFSLRPGVDYWDTGEMQTVPYILGIAHPTGFPGYTLFGWLYTHLLPLGTVAWRMNVLSALATTATCWFIYRIVRERAIAPEIAAGSALIFAFTKVAWEHATRADVHPVEIACGTAALYALLRWERSLALRDLAWAAAAYAAALTVHSGAVLLLPGLFVIALGKIEFIRARGWIAIGCAIVCVPLVYAYLPLRSQVVTARGLDPTVALGIPIGRPFWDYDHPASLAGFRRELTGSEFNARAAIRSIVAPDVLAQVPSRFGKSAARDIPYALLFLALIGIVVTMRRPYVGGGIVLFGFIALPFVLGYEAESDIERYFLPAYVAIAIFVGIGAAQLARLGEGRLGRGIFAFVLGVYAVIIASDVWTYRDLFTQPNDRGPQAFVDRIKAHTPRNAIVVVSWTYATTLAYEAYVERALEDRIVVTAWYTDYERLYPGWLATRPVIVVTEGVPALRDLRLVPQDGAEPAIYRVLR